jgi:hypothetical protein
LPIRTSRRRDTTFQTTRIPVLGIEDLIKSKSTDREQDRADAAALREIAGRAGKHP